MNELNVSHRREFAEYALLDFHFTTRRPEVRGVGPVAAMPGRQPFAPPSTPRRYRDPDAPAFWVPLPALDGDREAWLSEHLVECGRTGGRIGSFEARWSGNLLALCGWRLATLDRLAYDTRQTYLEALDILHRAGYPHLLRVWNHVPDINGGRGETNGYQQFCVGRGSALRQLGLHPADLPAASALGCSPGMPLQVTFLASRIAGRHLENPRQRSAHHYPGRYGPEPPCFARATLYGRQLLISGTAAIIGHESQHPGRIDRQLRCIVDNLLMLMDHACAEADARRAENLHARVYLRHPGQLGSAREMLATDLPNLTSAIFIQAELCRPELLLEIEATGTLR